MEQEPRSPDFANSHAYEPHTRRLFPTMPNSNAHTTLPNDNVLAPQPRHNWDTAATPRNTHLTLDADQSIAGPLYKYRSTYNAVSVSQTELPNDSVGSSTGSVLASSTTRTQVPLEIYSSTEDPRLSQHASLVTSTALTGLPEHYDAQHWLGRPIESQYITQPTNNTSEKRPYRCFSCRQDPGNRKCFNYPICNRCTIRHSKCESDEHLQQDHFLDWRYMLSVCQKLNKTSQTSQTTSHQTFSGPVILEFTHYDRLLQSQWEPFIVVFRPELQALNDPVNATETECELRAPAFYKDHLDALIRGGVWGRFIWDSDDTRFSADELNLWNSVRLFIGSHALLHNLATTFVEAAELATASLLARIVAELVYAIGFYLQFHYYEIISTISSEKSSPEKSKISPAVRLYSLEVLLRCTTSMRKIDWGLSEQSPPHPLLSLERYLNTQIEHVWCQFNQLECRTSGESYKNRHMRPPPAVIEFAKSLPASNFPKHCVIKVYRHRFDIPPMASSVPGEGPKYRGIDMFNFQDDDFFACSMDSRTPPLWCDFDHVVTHNNKVVGIREVIAASSARLEGSGNGVNNQQDDSRQADSNVSELALRLLALQQDSDARDCLSDSNTLISVEMTGIDESPPPSLVAGTPLSMLSASSPGTPAPSVTIGSYWARMNDCS